MMRNSPETPSEELTLVDFVYQTKDDATRGCDLPSVNDITFAIAASRPRGLLDLANAAFAEKKAYYASLQQLPTPEDAAEELPEDSQPPLEPATVPRHALRETAEYQRDWQEYLAYSVGLGQQVHDERRSAHRVISWASGVVATAAIASLAYALFSPLYRVPEDTTHQDEAPQFASQLSYDTRKDITTFSVRVRTEAHPDAELTAEDEAKEQAIVKDGAKKIIIDLQKLNIAEISTLHVHAQTSGENSSAPNAGLDAPDEQNNKFATAQAVRGEDDFGQVAKEARVVISNVALTSAETALNENSIAILTGQAEELGISLEDLIGKYEAGEELSPEASSALASALDENRSLQLSADVKGRYTPHLETKEEREKRLPPLAIFMENPSNSVPIYVTGSVLSVAAGILLGLKFGNLGQGHLARWRARRTIKRAKKAK